MHPHVSYFFAIESEWRSAHFQVHYCIKLSLNIFFVTTMSKAVVWKPCTPETAPGLHETGGRTPVVGGYEGTDGSTLWVIRAMHNGDMIPGKLRVQHKAALVPYYGDEHHVTQIEVCCADPDMVCWVKCRDGEVPPTAVQGGWTRSGEALYIGRAERKGSLTPGKVHPTHKCMYMPFGFKEHTHTKYEVLCTKEQ